MLETDTSGSESDSYSSFENYDNPNYRKLYATLSVKTMMGREEIAEDVLCSQLSNYHLKEDSNKELPEGWEKHEDENGPYFWHVSSGTIQREKPKVESNKCPNKRDSMIYYEDEGPDIRNYEYNNDDDKLKSSNSFPVCSLGWMHFDECELTPELSSKAVQRCILELTSGLKSMTDELELRIENSHLKLSNSSSLIHVQPIERIRVWGVNDNNDFAFVARDPPGPIEKEMEENPVLSPTSPLPISGVLHPPPLKCHVFHCNDEDPKSSQIIANILRDEMIRIRNQIERKKTDMDLKERNFIVDEYNTTPIITSPSLEFPTPVEEPKKTIVTRYLGSLPIKKPAGIDILNDAIKNVIRANSKSKENDEDDGSEPLLDHHKHDIVVLMHISPSKIVLESTVNGEILLECRVRYLSFLGISRENVKHCGFIMQMDKDSFIAHLFQCEPSAGALCKTIEAACKLRYQKCLDAHKQRSQLHTPCQMRVGGSTGAIGGGIKSTLKNVFAKLKLN